MYAVRPFPLLIVGVAVLISCGDGETASTTTTGETATTTTEAVTTTTTEAAATTGAAATTTGAVTTTTATAATTAEAAVTTTTTEAVAVVQPAIWPASDVVFETPDAVAADFIASVFGVDPLLGEFMQGDSLSGEMAVLSPRDDDDPATGMPTGTSLLLRRLGSDQGWFVLAAVGDNVTITAPTSTDMVPAGSLTVEDLARGHERTVQERTFSAGVAEPLLDGDFTMAGLVTPEPCAVPLDLSAARPGETVAILVRGDMGLSNSTGEFASIPVVMAG